MTDSTVPIRFRKASRRTKTSVLGRTGCAAWLVLVAVGFADAQESMLVPLDSSPFQATVRSVDDNQVTFTTQSGEVLSYKVQDLVRWGHLPSVRAVEQVRLVDGSILLGSVAEIRQDAFELETELWGALTVPRSYVSGIAWEMPMDPVRQWEYREPSGHAENRKASLTLRNRDVIPGRLLRGDRTTLQLESAGATMDVKTSLVQSWQSEQPGRAAANVQHSEVVVGLRDGTKLVTSELRVDQALQARLRCGVSLLTVSGVRPIDEELVCYLRFDHARIRYLTPIPEGRDAGLRLLGYKHVPFLGVAWNWGADCNTLEGPLSSKPGVFFAKGVGMHSTSRLAFAWDDAYDEFQAEVCLDATSENQGSVVFRVFLYEAKANAWRAAFTSPVVRGGDAPLPVRLSLGREHQRLALVVDYADRGDVLDRANWLGARLVKH